LTDALNEETEVMAAEPIDYESYMKNDEFLARMKEKEKA
jgi:hypothetical protein